MSVQHLLEINVIGCRNLRNKEWFSRQDPYVVLEYAGSRYRTKTDTDGGRNPTFNEKYMLPLIEGLQEVNVTVWNSNMIRADEFIGSGKILLQKVLTDGYHDSTWHLVTESCRRSGDIRVIMHYRSPGNPNVTSASTQASAPMYPPPSPAHYAAPPVYTPPQPSGYPPPRTPYPPAGYPPTSPYEAQPPYGYPQSQPYPPQPQPYPLQYPPQGYPSQGYNAPPSGDYPPYQGGGWTR